MVAQPVAAVDLAVVVAAEVPAAAAAVPVLAAHRPNHLRVTPVRADQDPTQAPAVAVHQVEAAPAEADRQVVVAALAEAGRQVVVAGLAEAGRQVVVAAPAEAGRQVVVAAPAATPGIPMTSSRGTQMTFRPVSTTATLI